MAGGLFAAISGIRPADVAMSHDGATIWSTSGDGLIRRYDVATRQLTASWTVGSKLGALALSPDGSFLMAVERQPLSYTQGSSTFADQRVVTTYKVDTGTGAASSFPVTTYGYASVFYDVAVLSDGTAMLTESLNNATGSSGLVWRLDTRTGSYTNLSSPYVTQDSLLYGTDDGASALLEAGNSSADEQYRFAAGSTAYVASTNLYNNGYVASGGTAAAVEAISSAAGLTAEAFGAYNGRTTANRILVRDLSLHLAVDLNTLHPEFGTYVVNGLAFDSGGKNLFVLDAAGNQIVQLATADWSIVGSFAIGAAVNNAGTTFTSSDYGNRLLVTPDDLNFIVVTSGGLQLVQNNSVANNFTGTSGDDILSAGSGADTIHGVAGNDILYGDAGNDILYGDAGDDTLDGGTGADTFIGGPGADVFRGTEEELRGDTITDLTVGDRINVTSGSYATFNYIRAGSSLDVGGAVVEIGAPNARLALAPSTAGGTDLIAVNRYTGLNDFDGTGLSDSRWRNDDGTFSTWQVSGNMAGNQLQANATLVFGVDSSWKIQETFDWNGDGKSDLLWRNVGSGQLTIWTGAGAGFAANAYVDSSVGTDWKIAGVGDLNGDGMDDIVWRQTGGTVTTWLSTGTGFHQNAYVDGSVGTDWKIVGLADFDGDGKDDLLWRNASTGVFTEWQSTATGFTQNAYVNGSVGTDWHIVATADFNGDGFDDLLWRHDGDGTFTIWQSTGTGFTPNTYVDGSVSTAWQIAEAADFNDDGKADILWRNAGAGAFTTWQSNSQGFDPNVAQASGIDASWHIQAHDYVFG